MDLAGGQHGPILDSNKPQAEVVELFNEMFLFLQGLTADLRKR